MSVYSSRSYGPRTVKGNIVTSFRVRQDGLIEPLGNTKTAADRIIVDNNNSNSNNITRDNSGRPRDFDIYKQPRSGRISYPYQDDFPTNGNAVSINQVDLTPRNMGDDTGRTPRVHYVEVLDYDLPDERYKPPAPLTPRAQTAYQPYYPPEPEMERSPTPPPPPPPKPKYMGPKPMTPSFRMQTPLDVPPTPMRTPTPPPPRQARVKAEPKQQQFIDRNGGGSDLTDWPNNFQYNLCNCFEDFRLTAMACLLLPW
jgi:hypothetical protein